MNNKTKSIAIIAGLLSLAIILFLGYSVYRMDADDAGRAVDIERKAEESRWKLVHDGKEYKVGSYVETYLLVGTDNPDADNSDIHVERFYNHSQADFIMLLCADEDNGKITAIQINRDTMTDVPWLDVLGRFGGTEYRQIALAYNSGSGGTDSLNNTADAVSQLLFGIPIDHSAAFTMAGINTLNDLVGGVTVHIEDDLTPIDSTLKKGSIVTLRGKQAEHFLRARMLLENDTNAARMSRHREFINGFINSAKDAFSSDAQFYLKASGALSPYMVTDMTSDDLKHLADCIKKYGIDSIRYADGELCSGEYYEFYPYMDNLWSIVSDVFSLDTILNAPDGTI